MQREIVLAGTGLHSGAAVGVLLRRSAGAVRLLARGPGGWDAPVDALEVVSTARATTVRPRAGGSLLGTVEHALAALGGSGVYEGIELAVDGPELPLLDGGASRWCEAVASLAPPRSRPRARVTRQHALEVGPSRYEFWPLDRVEVEVRLDLDDPRLDPKAFWGGDPDDFACRIAPARTFAWAREVEELLRRGLARHVDPTCVVLITPDAIHHAGRPFSPDEPARHKLLDLVGDLYLVGGPPLGRVVAKRPGHACNARAIARALEDGVLRVN